jgi:hypothetical protein
MSIQVLVAYSKEESELANQLITPITNAGYDVWHRDSVLVGDSFTEEASKALEKHGPVVLCGTARAVGSKWAKRIVNAARELNKKVFIIQMEDEADVESLAFGEKIAHYWEDSKKATQDLIKAIRINYSSKPENELLVSRAFELESRYINIALNNYDIIDLTNLPVSTKDIYTKRIELRQLYVPLRLKYEIASNHDVYDSQSMALVFNKAERTN